MHPAGTPVDEVPSDAVAMWAEVGASANDDYFALKLMLINLPSREYANTLAVIILETLAEIIEILPCSTPSELN